MEVGLLMAVKNAKIDFNESPLIDEMLSKIVVRTNPFILLDGKYIPNKTKRQPFDPERIISSLMLESKISRDLAVDITLDIIRFLIQNEIKFVTAPRLREISVFFYERRGMELESTYITRIGFAPYDLDRIFKEVSDERERMEVIYRKISNERLALKKLRQDIKES